MKNSKIYVCIVIGLLIIAGLIYKSINTVEVDTVDVGVISILSGQFASIGENYVKGVRLAEEVFEQSNPDIQVDLHVEDDGFDQKKGISAFKKLTTLNKIDGLINISSPTIDSIYKDINEQGIPTTQFGIQSLGVADDYIFQISPSPKDPILKYGKYLKENTQFKKVAIVYENGQPFNLFYEAMRDSYGVENTVPMVVASKSDIQTYATRIALEKFDAVIILTMPESGALLVKKISTLTKDKITYVIDVQFQTGYENYKNILGNLAVLEGAYSIWLASDDNVNFKERYTQKYGEAPGMFADTGYDAFMTLMSSYNANTNTWKNNISKTRVSGASGDISFDERGIRSQDLEVKRIINGALTKVEHIKSNK